LGILDKVYVPQGDGNGGLGVATRLFPNYFKISYCYFEYCVSYANCCLFQAMYVRNRLIQLNFVYKTRCCIETACIAAVHGSFNYIAIARYSPYVLHLMVSWAHPSPHPKLSHGRLSRFRRVHGRDQHVDGATSIGSTHLLR